MAPKVSVVVPSYNVERYLPALIDCVLSQDEQSWELILVDDGSKDNTPQICDEAVKRDPRISTIHQENQGVSGARNSGIRVAKGEWIAFIDADDLITDTYLSSMLHACDRMDEVDLVYCSYAILETGRNTLLLCKNRCYIGEEELRSAFSDTNLLQRCCPWARMYRRSVILENNVWYDTKVATEDRTFNYEYMMHIRGLATTSTLGYLYGSFSATSLKHKKHPVDKMLRRQTELLRTAEDLCDKYKISGNGFSIIWRNWLRFFMETMESVYLNHGTGKESEAVLASIWQQCYTEGLQKRLASDKSIQAYIKSDELLRLVVNKQFHEYNQKMKTQETILGLKQSIHKLLNRKPQKEGSYATAYIKLN